MTSSGVGSRRVSGGSQAAFEVLRPGLLTTVQDRGRFGFQKFGVPVSGAVDEIALRVGNILVGNPQGAGALEISAFGPQLRMRGDAVLALTGAVADADLDGERIPWYQSFQARAGQILDIRTSLRGLRAYLAVAGGIEVPILLGSRSTCLVSAFGGFQGRALRAGDVLMIGPMPVSSGWLADRVVPEDWRPRHASPATIRVVLGPQDDAFLEEGRRTFLEATFEVTPQGDRMGCRLHGPAIAHRDSADILSDWVPRGGIQVPGDGQPIVLLADRQTTGGYAKIATVIGPDLGLVTQCRPGDRLQFRAISLAEAQTVTRALEGALAALPAGLIRVEDWAYAAEMGEIPGRISALATDGAAEAVRPRGAPTGTEAVRCPLAAVVAKVSVAGGETVAAGQPLLLLQAMKMEHEVVAPRSGCIVRVAVREGDALRAGDLLLTIEGEV